MSRMLNSNEIHTQGGERHDIYLFDDVLCVEVLVGVKLLLSDGRQNGFHRPLRHLGQGRIGRLRHQRVGDGSDALQR